MPTQNNHDLYALNKKVLEFFLTLEKKNSINKLILILKVNGNFIKDPTDISEAQRNLYQNFVFGKSK